MYYLYNFGLKEGREMKRFLIIIIVVSAMAALSVIFTQTANSFTQTGYQSNGAVRSQFIGLWGGVDPADGSEVLVSISDNDDDGKLELLWHENRWFSCGGSDNAVLTATGGTVQDGVLSFETAIISCFDTNEEIDVTPYTIESNRKANTISAENINLHRIDSRR